MNKAQDAYAAAYCAARAYAEAILAKLDDAKAPDDDTHWGHVGDMAHLAAALREIAEGED